MLQRVCLLCKSTESVCKNRKQFYVKLIIHGRKFLPNEMRCSRSHGALDSALARQPSRQCSSFGDAAQEARSKNSGASQTLQPAATKSVR